MWGAPGRGPLPPSVAPRPGEWQQCGGGRHGARRRGTAQQWSHCCPPLAWVPEGQDLRRGGGWKGAKCQSSCWAWLCSPWFLGRRRGRELAHRCHPIWGHRYPASPGRRGCGRMPGQEDALAAGCLGMGAVEAAPEPPGAVLGLAPGGTVGTPGLGRDRRVTQAGWAGGQAGRRACGQRDMLCYSAAPQVGGPGAAEPALPEGDRARLVRQGERQGQGSPGTCRRGAGCRAGAVRDGVWGEDGVRGEDGGDEPVPRPRCSWGR